MVKLAINRTILYVENDANAPAHLDSGTRLNEFIIDRLLSTGGFGQVFEGRVIRTNQPIAIKVESTSAKVQLLFNETSCLRSFNQAYNSLGLTQQAPFLKYYGYGVVNGIRFLAMEKCGENLRDLKATTALNRFSIPTSLWIFYKMITALEMMHKIGWLHRDVKPANFCVGLHDKHSLYTLDFGMSRCYVAEDGNLKPKKVNAPFNGTLRYVSLNIHRRQDASRWDDIWSAFYIAVENMVGFLPWRRAGDVNAVGDIKSRSDLTQLKYGRELYQPKSLTIIHSYLNASLSDDIYFYRQPPYQVFLAEIKSDLQSRQYSLDTVPLDWNQPKCAPAYYYNTAPAANFNQGDRSVRFY
ncbi:unnamed protein product [Caenorhabditis bovis]|uniref:Protein kinase domain-containing protein n=1 Tax=Caenorhabditis bovis TaxID=2654633 RepID=A0A8S1EZS5_9PELO|nr:unnamed protein product [Caenorhabditis bovis]